MARKAERLPSNGATVAYHKAVTQIIRHCSRDRDYIRFMWSVFKKDWYSVYGIFSEIA